MTTATEMETRLVSGTTATDAATTIDPVPGMRPLENLFVRACKAKNHDQRLRSVYRRFYWADPDVSRKTLEKNLTVILANIVENYNLVSIRDLIDALDPDKIWMYTSEPEDANIRYEVLSSIIRLAPISKFPGYRKSLRWRRIEMADVEAA